MLPTIKFGEKAESHLNHPFMCSAPENSFLSRRTYSDTSAELVEVRVGLTSFKTVTATPEQPVNVSELLKSTAGNTKANYQ